MTNSVQPSQWSNPAKVEKLIELAKAGVIYAEIARQLDTTIPCVRGKLEAMGIKRKHFSSQGEASQRKRGTELFQAWQGKAAEKARFNQEAKAETGNISAPRRFSWEDGA